MAGRKKKEESTYILPEFKLENEEVEFPMEQKPGWKAPPNTSAGDRTKELNAAERALLDNLKLARAATEYIRETIIESRETTEKYGKEITLPKYKKSLNKEDLKEFLDMVHNNAKAITSIAGAVVTVQRTKNNIAPDPNYPDKTFDLESFMKTGEVKFVKGDKSKKEMKN